MLGLHLREEFLGVHTPGTMIQLRDDSGTGAAEREADYILSITYPTADVQTALKNLGPGRPAKPIVLMGDRGRGKSHIMAVTHHAIASPQAVETWARDWGKRLGLPSFGELQLVKGFFPISEPVQNHEYKYLWDLIFDRHPKGEVFKYQFEKSERPYPPRSLLVEMFEAQPTALILDEFQKWFDGLSDDKGKSGVKYRTLAENFIQNLAELSKDRPDLLILIVSVLNNDTEAFRQIHRNTPVLVDFRGPTATQDRQNLVLHRLFENRQTFSEAQILGVVEAYAEERFRLRFSSQPATEKARRVAEVVASFPFSPELLELLDNQILMAQAAQETRDLISILALAYKARGEAVPLVTPADFFVDDDTGGVQSLIDSIAAVGEQEKLREIAQRNLRTVREAAGSDVPHLRELVSALWMRSMTPGHNPGGTRTELHLDITRSQAVDDNLFAAEVARLIENSINVHGEQNPDGRLFFRLEENPRSKVRATARNDKLWAGETTSAALQMTYPGKDIEHLRKTIQAVMDVATQQATSRIIVLGPNWREAPWDGLDDADDPRKWRQPVLVVFPEPMPVGNGGAIADLGRWLKQHVPVRRNTIRFLLPQAGAKSVYADSDLVFAARCSYLVGQAWKDDGKYRLLKDEFDRPFRGALKGRFDRLAVLRTWNFQAPEQCTFEVKTVTAQGHEIPSAIEKHILDSMFDFIDFSALIAERAKDHFLVGDILDELTEPPSAPDKECIPYLGDIHLFERIIEVVARGAVVLNCDGSWLGRLPEHDTFDAALPYIRSKAAKYMPEQAMRKIQLGLPGEMGGAVVPGAKVAPPVLVPPPSPPPSVLPPGGANPATPPPPNVPIYPVGSAPDSAENRDGVHVHSTTTPATGINMINEMEKWGLPATCKLKTVGLHFEAMTVQQARQLLQRLPSTCKGWLEVSCEEEY